jgi:hypothetical protein
MHADGRVTLLARWSIHPLDFLAVQAQACAVARSCALLFDRPPHLFDGVPPVSAQMHGGDAHAHAMSRTGTRAHRAQSVAMEFRTYWQRW